ncbi:MAG: F0F1 ATP synthase subunit A [Desulfovibrio sp.]|jgi:F-type H+-transporting ATPase subunit a|nr:F0F1 ATP synthase subunit A [Desulfovibrio sp.]
MAGGLPHPLVIFRELNIALGADPAAAAGSALDPMIYPVPTHVWFTWLAMAILLIAGLMVRRKLTLVPGGLQNFFELVVGGLEDFVVANIGEKGRQFMPILVTIFLFVLTMNYLGLVPGCDAPTANINTNAAMAIFVFLYYNYVGIKTWKAGYIKHFLGPMPALAPLMLVLEIISHLARPLSLTLRLFGNIRGEEIVLVLLFVLAPLYSTLPMYFLFILAKSIQALIFFMLTMIYLKGAVEHAH